MNMPRSSCPEKSHTALYLPGANSNITVRLSPGPRRRSVSQTVESDSTTTNKRLCSSKPLFASFRVTGPDGTTGFMMTTYSSKSISTSTSSGSAAGVAAWESLPPVGGAPPTPHAEMMNTKAANWRITAARLYLFEMMSLYQGHRKQTAGKRSFEANTICVQFVTIESNFKKDVEGQVVEGKAWSDPPRSVMS